MDQSIYKKVSAFFAKYPERHYPQGQILIFNGEEPDHIYFIQSGRVAQYDISYKGEEVTVNMFQTPAFFPITHAIAEKDNKFFYRCDVDTVVRTAPIADVKQFLKSNPDVVYDLLTRVYRGIDVILERMVHLMSGSAAERLAYELVAECKRFGKTDDGLSYNLKMTEVQLASQIGLTRETVSREIKKLKVLGLILVNGKGITVQNLPKLKDYL